MIKYFFQFGFFPFNQKLEVDRSKPFHPPNILGVEKKEGYVLYDLLQLLALFYHRAILKVEDKAPPSYDRRRSPPSCLRPRQCHGLWDQTAAGDTDPPPDPDDQDDSAPSSVSMETAQPSSTVRRRTWTPSSSTPLRSPAGGIERTWQTGGSAPADPGVLLWVFFFRQHQLQNPAAQQVGSAAGETSTTFHQGQAVHSQQVGYR